MEAKELRIGNWLKNNYDFGNKLFNYAQVDIDTLCDIVHGYTTDFEPIQLTLEILKRCKLEKNEHGRECFPGGRYVIVQMAYAFTLFVDNMETRPDVMEMVTGFHSLHQLQNLYFALTGQELEVTL